MNIGSTQWGVWGACNGKHTHTHTHCVPRDTEGGWNPEQGIDHHIYTCWRGPPRIKLMDYEHREDAVRGGRNRQCQTHTHTHSVPRDTKGGWSLG